MVQQNLLQDSPALLEQVVSLDWASPTALECETWGISKSISARIAFRPLDQEIWIIERNQLRIMEDTKEKDSVFYDLALRLNG